jgi:hypothetical protein
MTPGEQLAECAFFFERAYAIMSGGKASDYAPEGHIFIDVFAAGADLNVWPEEVFLVHIRKQLTAVRRWARYRALTTEGVEARLGDLANYLAFLHIMNVHGREVALGVYAVAEIQTCDNQLSSVGECLVSSDPCDRCNLIRYTGKCLAERYLSQQELSLPRTPKAPA